MKSLQMQNNQVNDQDIVERLKIRASIRRSITTRKSVQENKPDRIADLLDAAAEEILRLRNLSCSKNLS